MTDRSESDEESYSYTSSKIFYKRSRSKSRDVAKDHSSRASTKVYVSADEDDASEYRPVSKWAVDYNNRNYIRSMCNKNKGLHRQLKGRPPKFKIHYDNNYFTRSKVNAPKGLHRKIPQISRKYVPDNDDLADAEGWEFDYGPEFDQVEQDVNYIPEGRIIRRGCYRWYGVKRNDSDCDIKVEEERENLLNEELEKELKYGQEFLQSDIPYLEEERNKRYTRGGYRFYEVPRNIHDFKPEELAEIPRDPEWKRKYHCNGVRYLDLEMDERDADETSEYRQQTKKGKPFRRTILNKIYELKKEDSSKEVKRHGTRLSLIPGEGRQSLYEGIPDRQRYKTEKTNIARSTYKKPGEDRRSLYEDTLDRQRYGTEKTGSVRSVYKKKTEKFRSGREGGEYEEYQTEDTEKSYTEVRPEYEERQHRKAEDRSGRRLPDEDFTRKEKKDRRFDDYTDEGKREVGDRRRDKEKYYDRQELPSQKGMSHSQDRRHGNEIHYKQKEGTKIKGKTKDRNNINIHLQHIRDRGKIPKDANNFQAKSTRGTEKVSKSMPPHVNKGVKNVLGRMERKIEREDRKDKGEVIKKMPPHVEERIKNIREKLERKLEPADRKHTGQPLRNIYDFSSSDEDIDLMKHKDHPNDRGEIHNSGYEKYITENGSEIWVKKKEKYAELHHKNLR